MEEIGFSSSINDDCNLIGGSFGVEARCVMEDPSHQAKVVGKQRVPVRYILWFGAVVFGGVLLWRLFLEFPGQLTGGDYPSLVKLLLILVVLEMFQQKYKLIHLYQFGKNVKVLENNHQQF